MTVSSSDTRGPRRNSVLVMLLAGAALALTAFIGLGVWQVERLAWKEALIARVERHLHEAPVPAPGPSGWSTLNRQRDEYQPLQLSGRFLHEREALVRASTELGTGYWVITPLQTTQGYWVLVNRGFVPPELREAAKRAPQSTPVGDVTITGLLRFSEPGGGFLQDNDPVHGRWYSRDVKALAAAAALPAMAVAPYFVDAAAVAAPASPAASDAASAGPAWPRPGLTVLRFNNNHLVYAITWFALAAMMAGAIAYLVIDERRLRRLAPETACDELPRG